MKKLISFILIFTLMFTSFAQVVCFAEETNVASNRLEQLCENKTSNQEPEKNVKKKDLKSTILGKLSENSQKVKTALYLVSMAAIATGGYFLKNHLSSKDKEADTDTLLSGNTKTDKNNYLLPSSTTENNNIPETFETQAKEQNSNITEEAGSNLKEIKPVSSPAPLSTPNDKNVSNTEEQEDLLNASLYYTGPSTPSPSPSPNVTSSVSLWWNGFVKSCSSRLSNLKNFIGTYFTKPKNIKPVYQNETLSLNLMNTFVDLNQEKSSFLKKIKDYIDEYHVIGALGLGAGLAAIPEIAVIATPFICCLGCCGIRKLRKHLNNAAIIPNIFQLALSKLDKLNLNEKNTLTVRELKNYIGETTYNSIKDKITGAQKEGRNKGSFVYVVETLKQILINQINA